MSAGDITPALDDLRKPTAELLRRLELAISKRLDGILRGDHRGLTAAQGTESGDTRIYQPGDDVRRIDWNVTARMREAHVRETIADRELDTWLLVDLSPSLAFGTAVCEKRDLVHAAAAAVGFLASGEGNRIGALIAEPAGTAVIPARGGRAHLLALLERIMRAQPSPQGTIDLRKAMDRLQGLARRRGLCAVVSDFIGPLDWEIALRGLGARHELLAVEVVDPRELELPNVGMLAVVDPETGEIREVQTARASLRRRYAAAAAEERATIHTVLRRCSADHLRLSTDRDWFVDLVAFVVARRRRARAGASRSTAGAVP